ncbi:MAG: PTS sugar transporter subunit IIA [Pseudomonadota bacterium]
MKLINVLNPESVLCNVEVRSRKHAIEVVAKLICRGRDTLAETYVFENLIDRERLGCTALGNGIAIPHARVSGLSEPAASLIRLSSAIEFEKVEDIDVDLIFGLVVPEDYRDGDSGDFRALVATLSDEDRLAAMRSARTSRELFDAAVAGTDNNDRIDDDDNDDTVEPPDADDLPAVHSGTRSG